MTQKKGTSTGKGKGKDNKRVRPLEPDDDHVGDHTAWAERTEIKRWEKKQVKITTFSKALEKVPVAKRARLEKELQPGGRSQKRNIQYFMPIDPDNVDYCGEEGSLLCTMFANFVEEAPSTQMIRCLNLVFGMGTITQEACRIACQQLITYAHQLFMDSVTLADTTGCLTIG